ncbi:hypothetical protein AB0K16_31450 [Nonomuraea jabiensis]|uniref:hypothetical protein n=1 Tax=Nonomuraea jabiensis TaxID=882448 RepID=UPI00341F9172
MAEVAREAGVAVQTLYTSAPGGKPALAKLVHDITLAGKPGPCRRATAPRSRRSSTSRTPRASWPCTPPWPPRSFGASSPYTASCARRPPRPRPARGSRTSWPTSNASG